ncbi:hypothetical protein Dimus_029025 [Dionaea muscipula]
MDSSKVSLRGFTLSDVDDFLKYAGDDRVARYLTWDPITSKEEALSFLREIVLPHPWRHSICLDDRSIGYISIRPGQGHDRFKADLGYAVAVDHWGRGICTTALKMALSRAFKDLPYLVRIEAVVECENMGSQRVLEKVGFLNEGLLRKYEYCKGEVRDFYMYSFLNTDVIKP